MNKINKRNKFLLFLLIVSFAGSYSVLKIPVVSSQNAPVCQPNGGSCYYVSLNGSDANPGTFNQPWQSVSKAWLNARAGDIVYFRGGVYYVDSTIYNKFEGYDGTPDRPITFTSYPGETAVIDGSRIKGNSIFNHERNYYIVKNLYFRNARRGFFVGEDTEAVGNKFLNNVWTTDKGGDNVGFVVLQGADADNTVIVNNLIRGPVDFSSPTQNVHGNTAGIVAFRSTNLKILNNEISHVPIGIYFKHANEHQDDNNVIAYNYIYDTTRNAMQINCNYCRIHDNIFGSNNKPVLVNEANGRPGGDFNLIEHNTFFKTGLVLSGDTQAGDNYPGAQNNILKNNLFTESTRIHVYRPGRPHNTIMDYNLYPPGEAVTEYSDSNTYTLAQWRSYYGQDTYSVSGAPSFVGGSQPSKISDFTLTFNSPGKNAASDGKDMGADTSLVGVNGGNFILPICGNSVIEPGEQCDDGNTVSGDGCSATCQLEPTFNKADLNEDGSVDFQDLIALFRNWGDNPANPQADITGDSRVDFQDLIRLFQNWGPVTNNNQSECQNWRNQHPEWIFCDDFESKADFVKDGRYFEYNNDDGDFIPLKGVGLQNSIGMRARWQKGEVGAGGLKLAFGRIPNSYMQKNIRPNENFRDIYYRFYLKMQPGWIGNPIKLSRATSFYSANDWSQAMIAHVWGSSNTNYLYLDPVRCVGSNGQPVCRGYNDFNNMKWLGAVGSKTPIFNLENSGKWYCIETHVRLNDQSQNNGLFEVWINDSLEAKKTGLNFVGPWTDYGINAIFIENYWNRGSVQDQERYFDNFVVSTQKIGCFNL